MLTDAVHRRSAPVLGAGPSRAALRFHETLDDYSPTQLVDQSELAADFGIGRLLLKDESLRLGLPSFKILGASWGVRTALALRFGLDASARITFDELRAATTKAHSLTLVTATDGNHGRAIGRIARELGLRARVFVPAEMVLARRQAIADEGAEVVPVDGGYDDAVRRAAAEEEAGHLVVSDTSWPGYETVPRAVVDGYSTILWEVEDELRRRALAEPDLVVVPVGVGSLAAAVARHYRRPGLERPPILVSVEPRNAACMLASARADRVVSLTIRQDSIMSGLNCGTPSLVAWPHVSAAFDLFTEIEDETAREGMRILDRVGIRVGECAGGALGALRDIVNSHWREVLDLSANATAVVFLTEGVTDPAAYARIVAARGARPAQSRR